MRSWESDPCDRHHRHSRPCSCSQPYPCPPPCPQPCPAPTPCPYPGPTGEDGTTATASNLFAISNNKNVNADAAVPFDSTPVSSGNDISFDAGTPTEISIDTPGIYLVKFRADVYAPTGSDSIHVELRSDSDILDETKLDNIGGNSEENGQLVYLHGLVDVTVNPTKITVVSRSSESLIPTDAITFRIAKLIVIKLS